ncbi:MAG: flagellar biosynthesis protein FliQ [Actinomycetota bacterium]|nr:flagellar biosynthesis protein FliQ [Actinomycetota bacterium]
METSAVLDIAVQALWVSAKLAAPVLITALVVGFAISVLQSITQIQEVTLSFVPKAAAVGVVLLITGHWMITEMVSFSQAMFDMIPALIGGG